MKTTAYAIIAACLGMLVTGGVVALATASPSYPEIVSAEVEAHLDARIATQLAEVKARLQAFRQPTL